MYLNKAVVPYTSTYGCVSDRVMMSLPSSQAMLTTWPILKPLSCSHLPLRLMMGKRAYRSLFARSNALLQTKKIHEGRNIKRFREMLGIKQDALAIDLGDDWNQQKISLLQQKETIDTALLQQISAALKIPVEAIQNFDEELAVNIISNTFNDQANGYNYYPTFNFNPIEKMIELYERMLHQQKEMIEKMERLIEGK